MDTTIWVIAVFHGTVMLRHEVIEGKKKALDLAVSIEDREPGVKCYVAQMVPPLADGSDK